MHNIVSSNQYTKQQSERRRPAILNRLQIPSKLTEITQIMYRISYKSIFTTDSKNNLLNYSKWDRDQIYSMSSMSP